MSGTGQDKEAELLKKLCRSDPAAIEELYNTYFDRLYSLVFNQVGRDKQTAEDIVQETFLAAIDSIDKFRGQSKLYTWLCSIANHKITDFYRRHGHQSKRANQLINVSAVELDQIKDDEAPIPISIESEETHQAFEQALFSLPPDYRQVLILKYSDTLPSWPGGHPRS